MIYLNTIKIRDFSNMTIENNFRDMKRFDNVFVHSFFVRTAFTALVIDKQSNNLLFLLHHLLAIICHCDPKNKRDIKPM